MRYFFHIGYKGSGYSGWQKHAGAITVQQVMESALSKILKIPININGCGRTDALVHASQFFFHVDISVEWDFDMLFRLNKALPPDISVFDIIPMQGLPHARFDAIQRRYDYFIHTYKDPFLNDFSSMYLNKKFDFDMMRRAVKLLPSYNDYASFCTSPAKHEHTICNVTSADLSINAKADRIHFQISSNRFLSKMIRIIVGKLIKIGEGNLSLDEFESYLALQNSPVKLEPAHPQGLYLSKVIYPYLNLDVKPEFGMKCDLG